MRYATKAGSVNGFATPVANLAGILLSSGRADDVKTAADLLERTACDTHSAFAPIPCLYIEYQRAVLHNIRGRYLDGRTTLDHLLTVSWPAAGLPESSSHRLLLAYAHRNRAYSNARLADTNPAANRHDYERADRDWIEAERTFRSIGVPPPPRSYLTRARIQIGLGHVEDARAALGSAIAGGTTDLGVPLVEATIASCVGDVGARDAALGNYLVGLKVNQPDDFDRLTRDADRQLAAFFGLCRTSQEMRQ